MKNKGITLIALIITIIVLLILAGTAISMIIGNNSILRRAGEAQERTERGQEKEQVQLAYASVLAKNLGDNVTEQDLQKEVDNYVGENKAKVTTNYNGTLNVMFKNTNRNYNVDNGKVEEIKDGIYVGNVWMGGIHIPDWNNENLDDYIDGENNAEMDLSKFFQKCYDEEAEKVDYDNAINIANNYGINKEIIDYVYNNQGDRARNVQVTGFTFEQFSYDEVDVKMPYTFDYTSFKDNIDIAINIDIQFRIKVKNISGSNEKQLIFSEIPKNPESISFGPADSSEEIPLEVQIPLGMKLKYMENPYKPEDFEDEWTKENDWYEDENTGEIIRKEDWCKNEADLANSYENMVIEWQGQTFNCMKLRKFIEENIKLVYKGNVININEETTAENIFKLVGPDEDTFIALIDS